MKKMIIFLVLISLIISVREIVNANQNQEYILKDKYDEIVTYNKTYENYSLYDLIKKEESIFIYNTLNIDSENTPVATFINKYNGIILYKDFFSTEENCTKLAIDIQDYYEESYKILKNPKEAFFANANFDIIEKENKRIEQSENTISSKLRYMEVINKDLNIEVKEIGLVSGEWTLNPKIYSAQKDFKPYGRINFINVFYEQISLDHYFTRYQSNVDFIPGQALRDIGKTDYNSLNCWEAYYKTSLLDYYEVVNGSINYGDEPKGIDYWPINGPAQQTVSSAWGLSGEVGYSQKDGVQGKLIGSFSRGSSYTSTSPILNAFMEDVQKNMFGIMMIFVVLTDQLHTIMFLE